MFYIIFNFRRCKVTKLFSNDPRSVSSTHGYRMNIILRSKSTDRHFVWRELMNIFIIQFDFSVKQLIIKKLSTSHISY